MTNRSYNQYCGIAYALEAVGERWTLLIVRELIAGPRRFKDLMAGLPEISTNLLAERLKRLEQQGVIDRRAPPPPAGSTVYELTPLGQALEPMLLELGKWGSQFVPPSPEGVHVLGVGSYALTLKIFSGPRRPVVWTKPARSTSTARYFGCGSPTARPADAEFDTDMPTYLGLLQGQIDPGEAVTAGRLRIEDDPVALRRFLRICGIQANDQ